METTLDVQNLNNVSEIEVIYKKKVNVKTSERPLIKTSADCYSIFRHYWDENKIDLLEEFKVLFLNRANRVLYLFPVSLGGTCGTVADPKIILSAALKVSASSLILAHNHPSGNTKPSKADEDLTKKIKQAAFYHDITVLDHIILTSESYLSFADEGLL